MALDTVLVTRVEGTAWIRTADGSKVAVKEGMRVPVNAEIITETGASVELEIPGSPSMTISDNRSFLVSGDIAETDVDPVAAALANPNDPAITAVLAALEAGDDPFSQLDPTAAVLTGGGEGGGSSFTRLVSIVETTRPLALEYPRPGVPTVENVRLGGYSGTGEEEAGPLVPPSVTVKINDDGTVTFTFTEVPFGFDIEDIEVTDGGRIEGLTPDNKDPKTWTGTLVPPPNYEGEITVKVPDGSYTNEVGTPGNGGEDTTTVDTLPPEAEITIDSITEDGVINKEESEGDVTITGTVGKDVKPGDKVTVTVGGKEYETTVNPDGKTWSVDVPGSELVNNDKVEAKVTTTDDAGNSTTVTTDRTYDVDVTPPEAEIKIDPITDDGVINKEESGGNVTITGTVGKDVKPGDKVTVSVGDKDYETTVNPDGKTWSVDVPGSELVNNDKVEAKVTTTDDAGNSTTATDEKTYDVDTTAPEATITIDKIAGDDVVNKEESEGPVTLTGTLSVKAEAADTVTVKVTIGTNTYDAVVNADRTGWTLDVAGSELAAHSKVEATVTVEDAAGNSATDTANRPYGVDTTAPEATITIDKIAGDDVVNKEESEGPVTLTGTLSVKAEAADTVTVKVTIGTNTYDAVVNADRTGWTLDVAGSELAAHSKVEATVTVEDAAGNSATDTANRPYGVDTTAPEATITIDKIAGDDVVNKEESEGPVTLTGTLSVKAEAADTVTVKVTIGTNTYDAVVNADRTGWTLDVAGSELAAHSKVEATVTVEDAAGNSATDTANRPYDVDTTAPEATITIDKIAGDDVVNKEESEGPVTLTGTLSVKAEAADTVTVKVTIGTNTYDAVVNADRTGWTLDVAGSELAAHSKVEATVTVEDAAGNSATDTANRPYDVDTTAPEATITIDKIAGDDVVNKEESEGPVTLTGTLSVKAEAADTVTVKVTIGTNTYDAVVNADRTGWTLDVAGSELAAHSKVEATVTVEDAAGNSATDTANRPYDVDTTAPEATITIDKIAGDDVVNKEESEGPVTLTGTLSVKAEAADTVTVKVTIGTNTYDAVVNADRTGWTLDVAGSELAAHSKVEATVTVEDAAGNSATDTANRPYGVDTTAPEATITIDKIAGDDVVNKEESEGPVTLTGTLSVKAEAADTVTVKVTIGTNTYDAVVNADRTGWTLDVAGSELAAHSKVEATVTVEDAAGNSATDTANRPYDVDTTAPEATITIDKIAGDDVVNKEESEGPVTLTGTLSVKAEAADTVTVKVTIGTNTYDAVVNADRTGWTLDVAGSELAAHSKVEATVTVEDAAGNSATDTANRPYDVDTTAPEATITIDKIAGDDVVNKEESEGPVTLTGTLSVKAEAADTVTVKVTIGTNTYDAVVNADRTGWTLDVAGSELAAHSKVEATVTVEDAAGNSATDTANRPYDVDTTAPEATITIDKIAGDDVVNKEESEGPVTLTGTLSVKAEAADTVTVKVTIGTNTYDAVVNADRTGWTLDVAGSELAAHSKVEATVTVEDAAGNSATDTANRPYGVDTTAPEATITIDKIAGDDVVNKEESEGPVTLTGTLSVKAEAADTVTVKVTIGTNTYDAVVNADRTGWTLDVAGSELAAHSKVEATVTVEDAAGNSATDTANRPYDVDTTAPEATITIDKIAGDDVVNKEESEGPVTLTGTLSVKAEAADTVTVKVTIGTNTYDAVVNADRTGWTLDVAGSELAAHSKVEATVTVEDAAGNSATDTANRPYDVDTTAPEATITIDKIAGDDVVNKEESEGPVTLTGTLSVKAEAADTVTVKVTIGTNTYDAVVNADRTGWTLDVAGSELAAHSKVEATVTVEDAAGNSATDTANRPYDVDTTAPEATITIDKIAGDDVVNKEESEGPVTLTGTLSVKAEAADTVTVKVTIGTNTYDAVVNADRTGWTLDVAGSELAAHSKVEATVTVEDAAGNSATDTANRPYGVDTTAPEATITIDKIAGDDVVNKEESEGPVTLTGTLSVKAEAADTVTVKVTIGTNTYDAVVNADRTGWTLDVAGSELAAHSKVEATVTVEDAAGNSATDTANRPYDVDTTAPEATITIDKIAGDDVVNKEESEGPVTLTGTLSVKAEAADTVTVKVTIGTNTYDAVVNADRTGWTLDVAGSELAAHSKVEATVTVEDAAGNSATDTANRPYDVDTTAPEATITIDKIAGDDVVNKEESEGPVTLTGTLSVKAEAADTVTVKVTIGTNTYDAVVNADRTGWTLDVAGSELAAHSKVEATVTVEDAAGNSATDTANRPYDVDTTAPEATITIDKIAGDDVVNKEESEGPVTLTGTLSVKAEAADTVTVKVTIGTNTYDAVVNADRTGWTLDVAGSELAAHSKVEATVTVEDAAGNSATDTANRPYDVDTTAPEATITIDKIAGDDVVNKEESEGPVTLTGTLSVKAEAADTVTVKVTIGTNTYDAVVNADRTGWTLDVAGSELAAHSKVEATVTVEDAAGNSATDTANRPYDVDTTAPEATITIDKIAGDDVVNKEESEGPVTLTGTLSVKAEAADTVTVKVTIGTNTYDAVVNADRTGWTLDVAGSELAAHSKVEATVTVEDAAGNSATDTANRPYDVDTTAPEATITIDKIAGDDVVNKEESEGPVTLTGTLSVKAEAADTVTVKVTIGTNTYDAVVNADRTGWTLDVAGSELAAHSKVEATVTVEDAAGNSATDTANRPYDVDTTAPEATITIDKIAGDDVVNKEESEGPVTLTGTLSVKAEAADTVTVKVTIGTNTYDAVVNADRTGWTLDVAGSELAAHSKVEATVTVEDAAGNSATDTANRPYGVDTTAPEATITIDKIAGDDVVNKEESEGPVTLTGTLSVKAEAADTVTVKVTIGTNTYDAVVNADRTGWTLDVAGSELAAHSKVEATVTVEDAAGNSATDTANRPYDVDTTAPEATITIDKIAGDDVVNKEESEGPVTLTGTLSVKAEAADTVTVKVTIGTNTYDAVVNADRTGWTLDVAGSELAAHSKVEATVTVEDAAGNSATDTANRPYDVDTTAPEATITIDKIAGDDVVNKEESEGPVTLTGTLSVKAEAADTVTVKVTIGTNTYDAVVNADRTGWTLDVAGSELAAHSKVEATVTVEDAAGNSATDTANRPYGADTAAPSVVVTINDDGTVSFEFSEEINPDSFTMGSITTSSGTLSGLTQVDGKTWTATLKPNENFNGSITVSVKDKSYEDLAGNKGTPGADSQNFDRVPPQVEITLTEVSTHEVRDTKISVTTKNGGEFSIEDGVAITAPPGFVILEPHNTGWTQPPILGPMIFDVRKGFENISNIPASQTGYIVLTGPKDRYVLSSVYVDPVTGIISISDILDTQTGKNLSVSHALGVIFDDGDYIGKPGVVDVDIITTGYDDITVELDALLGDDRSTMSDITVSGFNNGASLQKILNKDGTEFTEYTVNGDGTVTIKTGGESLKDLQLVVKLPVESGKLDLHAEVSASKDGFTDVSDSDDLAFVTSTVILGTGGDDTVTGTSGNDVMIADVSGLQIMPGQNYNIAFLVDTSGSMGDTGVANAKAALLKVFDSLLASSKGAYAGTVNVYLSDFDSHVQGSVSVNLKDPEARAKLVALVDSMTSGGGTNYEDAFKQATKWFDSASVKGNEGKNLTYFITDGKPTFYVKESASTNPVLYKEWGTSVTLDAFLNSQGGYTPGTPLKYWGTTYVDKDGLVYNSKGDRLGALRQDGNGYKFTPLGGTGGTTNTQTLDESHAAYDQLAKKSVVEAIGIGKELSKKDLEYYDSDGKVLANIDPADLADAILGKGKDVLPGKDSLFGGDGDDILFGDQVRFDGVEGEGLTALQAYIAGKLNVPVETLTTAKIHQYITEHSKEFNLSHDKDGGDHLSGGKGNDILYGQGGNDILDGGEGNDILFGGAGDDILTGGLGDDVFVWTKGDEGTKAKPAVDHITDFGVGNDTLDITDLLSGHNINDGNLALYLSVGRSDTGKMEIGISSQGNGQIDQKIILDNIDFDAERANQIANSLKDGTLKSSDF
ncbi:Ig-like domain-containing protein [Alcaligenes faecalis]|uniref:Ig-like domain-containing protein n=1 Tax=Alcaligenes faecalis TaxID=511 RepID=UPI00220B9F58|nr:Ig-like domain-containing protein [Alcaligenes faecalis]USP47896.1 Ig-like domain-containing protein [Alcaligenes faecalis]